MKTIDSEIFAITITGDNERQGRYSLRVRKHGDTAYIRLQDMQAGMFYEIDDISWGEVLLLIEGKMTWEDVLFDDKEQEKK